MAFRGDLFRVRLFLFGRGGSLLVCYAVLCAALLMMYNVCGVLVPRINCMEVTVRWCSRTPELLIMCCVFLGRISGGVSSDCSGFSSSDIECSCSTGKCCSREQKTMSEGGVVFTESIGTLCGRCHCWFPSVVCLRLRSSVKASLMDVGLVECTCFRAFLQQYAGTWEIVELLCCRL